MVEEIFTKLEESFHPNADLVEKSYYFSVDEIKRTVILGPDKVRVMEGKAVEEADCVCKTSAAFFLKIWHDGYRPGMQDFLAGTIKSNNPYALKDFLSAFGK